MKICARKCPHVNRRGFTLVELLVVLAILTVLGTMLVPAVNKALARAKSASCLSNLKQLGQACMLYSSEKDGELPPGGLLTGDDANDDGVTDRDWSKCWPQLLVAGKYVPGIYSADAGNVANTRVYKGALWCPVADPHNLRSDYGLSVHVGAYSKADMENSTSKLSEIKNPQTTILLCDSRSKAYGGSWILSSRAWIMSGKQEPPPNIPYPPRHGNSMNAVFCDGHVESIDLERLYGERRILFTGPFAAADTK